MLFKVSITSLEYLLMTLLCCLVWLPIVIVSPPSSLGKGVGVPPENRRCEAHLLNIEWWHSWTPFNEQNCPGRHIPMVWGATHVDCVIEDNCLCYYRPGVCSVTKSNIWIFANEPNARSQANWPPEAAAVDFNRLNAAYPDIKWIVGNLLPCSFNPPDCTMPESEWMIRFLENVEDTGAIWAIGVHDYKWSDCAYDPAYMTEFGYPIIITEVARPLNPSCYPALKSQMDTNTLGYAFFASHVDWPYWSNVNMLDAEGNLTELGEWYYGQ
jgi:hypothetical protein